MIHSTESKPSPAVEAREALSQITSALRLIEATLYDGDADAQRHVAQVVAHFAAFAAERCDYFDRLALAP